LAGLLQELSACQRALGEREAELAACIPRPLVREDPHQLAQRLEAVLRGGARAIDCQAAAMYLLDEDTAQLKLRAAWGVPTARLADEPRPLEGATADLEALVGHAVVLEDERMFDFWLVPESGYSAAVCVPVSSPTTILGTLWFYSTTPRSFSERDTELAEIIAGRLAGDLERAAVGLRNR
jgi:GAF domain-containing protein